MASNSTSPNASSGGASTSGNSGRRSGKGKRSASGGASSRSGASQSAKAASSSSGGRGQQHQSQRARSARGGGGKSRSNSNGGGLMARSMDGLRDASTKAAESVKEHPVPALLVGAGLGYLAAYSLRKSMPANGLEAVSETLSNTAETVKDSASRLGEYAGESISNAGSALKNAGATVGEEIEHGYEATRDALSETWDRHPLMVCAAVLAAGAAAGFLMPRSHAEDQALGK